MRNTLIFAFFSLILNSQLTAMETPAEEKTWTWEIFHIIDQWTDPLSYFTDPRAPKVCDDVMRFGLPTNDTRYREYTGDAQCLEDVKSVLKRQRALITSLEAECLKENGSKVELLRDAYDRQKDYYSQNVLALIESYLKRSTNTARNIAHTLDKQAGKTLEAAPVPTHLSSMQPINESRAITYKTIEELVTGNPGKWNNTVNYFRKNFIDPLKYLNDEKAQSISLAMRHLHPRHTFHTPEWEFNNKLEFHRNLIHQALERETKLTQALQHALEKKKSWMIVSINPENPDLKSVMANIASCYSPVVCAIIKGYLTSEANKKEREVKEKEKKEREQKELTEKNREISTLMHSLGRKFSDASNKGKFEIERAKFNQLRSSIVSHSLNSQEVLEKHAALTQMQNEVEAALKPAASAPQAAPLTQSSTHVGNPSAPELKPAALPLQMVMDTKATALLPAPPVAPASLPTPLDPSAAAAKNPAVEVSPTPATTPFAAAETPAVPSISPSASTSGLPNPPSVQSSPQASPPQTPDGSLVIPAASTLKKSEDDFDPRGTSVPLPASNPAQAKLAAALTPTPAQAKQIAAPENPAAAKNGKKGIKK